jgi:hypothetical protein
MSTNPPIVELSPPATAPNPQAAYLAESSQDLVAMSFPGAHRIAGWLFWVIFPLLCLTSIIFAIVGIAGHLGSHPTGIKGTYSVTGRTCSHGVCSIGGTFTSDEGAVTQSQLLGDPRWHVGEDHRVVYEGKSVEVIALPAHWDPTTASIAGIGSATYLTVVGYFALAARRERAELAAQRETAD